MMSSGWHGMTDVVAGWGLRGGRSHVAGRQPLPTGLVRTGLVRTALVGSLIIGSLLLGSWAGAASLAASPWTPLQEASIEVTSQGAVEVAPDIMWIEGRLSGSGDLPEAQKILAGLKGDISKALDDPEFAEVKVEYSRRLVRAGGNSAEDMQRQMMEMMGEGPAAANPTGEFTMSEDFRLVLSGLTPENFEAATARMLKLAGALTDRQIKLGKQTGLNPYNPFGEGANPGQFLRVGMAEPAAVWKSASQAAFASAQSQASSLAEIAGGRLGPALSIAVEPQGHGSDDASVDGLQELFLAQYSGAIASTRSEVSQATLEKIPVRVTLRVRFAFQPAGS